MDKSVLGGYKLRSTVPIFRNASLRFTPLQPTSSPPLPPSPFASHLPPPGVGSRRRRAVLLRAVGHLGILAWSCHPTALPSVYPVQSEPTQHPYAGNHSPKARTHHSTVNTSLVCICPHHTRSMAPPSFQLQAAPPEGPCNPMKTGYLRPDQSCTIRWKEWV